MSKEAALRAMREANFAQRSSRSTTAGSTAARPTAAAKPAKPTVRPAKAKPAADPAAAPAESTDELCGHRSMNGRACTREHGHAAKSHRYS